MSTAMKFENCSNIQITNCRSSGFDVGIDARDSSVRIDDYVSNDHQALNFSNVSGSLNNVRAVFQKGLKLADVEGAQGVRQEALKSISAAHIPHGDREELMAALNRVFDSSNEEELKSAKSSFLEKAAQYSTLLGFVWQIVISVVGG